MAPSTRGKSQDLSGPIAGVMRVGNTVPQRDGLSAAGFQAGPLTFDFGPSDLGPSVLPALRLSQYLIIRADLDARLLRRPAPWWLHSRAATVEERPFEPRTGSQRPAWWPSSSCTAAGAGREA